MDSIFPASTPDLDVEVLKGSIAVGGKDVVADSREMIDVPIKGPVVEVAPCATYSSIVSWIEGCEFTRGCKGILYI